MTNINNGDNGSSIIQAFPWSSFFLRYFTFRLPSNITVFSDICLNQAHILKAQNKCSQLPLFTQNQQIFLLIIISCWRISSDHVDIKTIDYFQSTTTFRAMSGKNDFSLWKHNIWFYYFFEDKGRLHVHHNRIKTWSLPGQSLSSELEWDCHQ